MIVKTPSLEPQGQYQPNLAQSFLKWKGFKFVLKAHYHLLSVVHPSVYLSVCKLFTFLTSLIESLCEFQLNLAEASLGGVDSSLFKWRAVPFSKARWLWNSKKIFKNVFKNILKTSSKEPQGLFQPNLANLGGKI